MARPLRIEKVGGWYHITARGNVRDQFHAPNLLGGDHRLHALLPKQHIGARDIPDRSGLQCTEVWKDFVIQHWRSVERER